MSSFKQSVLGEKMTDPLTATMGKGAVSPLDRSDAEKTKSGLDADSNGYEESNESGYSGSDGNELEMPNAKPVVAQKVAVFESTMFKVEDMEDNATHSSMTWQDEDDMIPDGELPQLSSDDEDFNRDENVVKEVVETEDKVMIEEKMRKGTETGEDT